MTEENKTDNYNYNYITITRKERKKERKKKKLNKKYPILHLYVSQTHKIIHDKLVDILDREGKSVSEWFFDQAEPYVRLHSLGNPQQRLDIILIDKKAYTAPKFCGFRGCNREAFGFAIYLQTDKRYPLCKFHYQLAMNDWKDWRVEN